MKDIKKLNKWKDTPCSGIERLNSVKFSFLPNLIDRFNVITTKNSAIYFMAINKHSKFIWRGKRPRIAKAMLKNNKVTGLILPNFETYYKVIIIKIVWYLREN